MSLPAPTWQHHIGASDINKESLKIYTFFHLHFKIKSFKIPFSFPQGPPDIPMAVLHVVMLRDNTAGLGGGGEVGGDGGEEVGERGVGGPFVSELHSSTQHSSFLSDRISLLQRR